MTIVTPLVVATVLVGSTIAYADKKREAGDTFARAERAFADEDYPEALRLFRTAFEMVPNEAVRFNIAVCFERLGRFREAGLEYEAAAKSASLAADVRARAKTEAERVRARLGTVSIGGEPAGASVRVDGVELCNLPCRIELDPGRREIVVAAGVATDRAVVEIARGATSEVTLRATIAQPPPARGPGVLTWTGGGLGVVGTGVAIYFGLRTRSLHEEYLANPTVETRDEGLRARDIANVSIAVAAIGAALVAVDLFILARR